MQRYQHWINGLSTPASSGDVLPTLDPMTTEPWAEIARGEADDVAAAVAAAQAAFPAWRDAGILWRLGDLIAEHADELAALEARDAGKVVREVKGQMVSLRAWYHYYASLAYQAEGRTIPQDRASITVFTQRIPYGVVGVIPAFNSPMLLGGMGLAPALAAGNTVVVKPPEVNSLSLLRLGELAQEAGLPDGCLNIVTGLGQEAGDALVAHPLVRKIWFTGGPDSARFVAERAAQHLKPLVLELGGKSANIFFDDVRIDDVVNGVIAGIFAAAGQTCVAGSRLLVHESIADRLIDTVAARARTIRLGDPVDPETDMGPMSQEKILAGVASRVDEAVGEGAHLVVGGAAGDRPDRGWFYPPTVLAGVTNQMSVITFADEDEAIAIANDSPFALAAGVWTRDLGRAHRVARQLDTGTVWVNMYRALQFATPFGGNKLSGYGRENGLDGFAEFTQPKAVWVESADEPVGDPFVLRA
jgi:acyl-CoA reductase-like NAD-dependent aldehyde dehydrogenase